MPAPFDVQAMTEHLRRDNYFIFESAMNWNYLSESIAAYFDLSDKEKLELIRDDDRVGGDLDAFTGNFLKDPVACRETLILTKSFFNDDNKSRLPQFADAWNNAIKDANTIKMALFQALSSDLTGKDFTSQEIADLEDENTIFLKLNKYEPSLQNHKTVVEPHADLDSFVIVYSSEDDQSLQVRSASGAFVSVVIPQGKAAVILGDSLQMISDNKLQAGVHRVVKSSTSRISLNVVALPNLHASKDALLDKYDAIRKPETVLSQLIDVHDIVEHWKLIDSVVGEGDPLPKYSEAGFWRIQIGKYFKYQQLRANYLRSHNLEVLSPLGQIELSKGFPDPPREIYYVWIVHMLQPAAYKMDCLEKFSFIMPHHNHKPSFYSAELEKLWLEEYGCLIAEENIDCGEDQLSGYFKNIDWWKGMDGVASMHKDILAEASELCCRHESDIAFLDRSLQAYKTYIEMASSRSSCCGSLAPGIYVDFVWHTHQCLPVEYSAFMDDKLHFVDHNPCGELNPFDPTWMMNTEEEWERFVIYLFCLNLFKILIPMHIFILGLLVQKLTQR